MSRPPLLGGHGTAARTAPTPVVLVVADDDRAAEAAALGAALEVAGLGVVTTAGEHAAGEVARLAAAAGPGGGPLGIVGLGRAGSAAAAAALDHGETAALALLDTVVAADDRAALAEWEALPVLTGADPGHRDELRTAVDVHLGSTHAGSDLVVGPIDPDDVARWLGERFAAGAHEVDEVTVTSADGWEVHGTRWLPRRVEPVPGVVLLHSGRSDRAVYGRLERLLADAGFAVLNLDWRGRGRSTGGGTYFALSPDERAAGWLDAAAALDHLGGLPGVDGDRLAGVGVVHGAEHAARAAQRDPRVKALVLLTGYRPGDEAEGAHLTSGAVDVLYVTSTAHRVTTEAMRALYEATPPGRARYVAYPGGAIGYQLFEVDPGLEPSIVAWLAEVLAGG